MAVLCCPMEFFFPLMSSRSPYLELEVHHPPETPGEIKIVLDILIIHLSAAPFSHLLSSVLF